jgi:hypothetical protein
MPTNWDTNKTKAPRVISTPKNRYDNAKPKNPRRCSVCGLKIRGDNHERGEDHGRKREFKIIDGKTPTKRK